MTKLTVTSPAELISAVPFLIGFHPADSLTVVALRGAMIAFVVRIDLPEPTIPEEAAKAAIQHLASVVLAQQVKAVTIIGYGPPARVTPALLRLSDVFSRRNVRVVDELRVADGRYWSYVCDNTFCCPPEGRPCAGSDSVLAAQAVFAGSVALPSREAVVSQVAPVTGDDREAMIAASWRATQRLTALAERPGCDQAEPRIVVDEAEFFRRVRRAGRAAVRDAERAYRGGARLSDDEVAWLGLLLTHLPIRDYAWTRSGTQSWEIACWSDVLRRVAPEHTPAPASILAFVAWRSGQGPIAGAAVERALEQQEDYWLAVVLDEALLSGMPPSVVDNWPALDIRPAADLLDAPPVTEHDRGRHDRGRRAGWGKLHALRPRPRTRDGHGDSDGGPGARENRRRTRRRI